MVHYAVNEMAPARIRLPDKRWHNIGKMPGTADLIAQMSDRCYLEKYRDRLFPEFILGGMTVKVDEKGDETLIYESPEDLLRKTPAVYENEVENRLDKLFSNVYSYEIAHFEGESHYINGLGGIRLA